MNAAHPPLSIELYGKRLPAIGRGKYPYECIAKDKWPDGMIYYAPDAGWTHEHSPCFLKRDQSKDVYTLEERNHEND